MTGNSSLNDAVELSQQLLHHVKTSRPTEHLLTQLRDFPVDELSKRLRHDTEKKAFWINIYNACSILLLKQNPEKLTSSIEKLFHFASNRINIADRKLSLNDIEHGMLRHSRIWWAKGYLPKPMVSRFEKKLRVAQIDPRVHFALNCGAASCPPIRFYDPGQIDKQLDWATEVFLDDVVTFHNEEDTVTITPLFDWYQGDFGGKEGVLVFLKQYKQIPEDSYPAIKYGAYDWQAKLDAFVD